MRMCDFTVMIISLLPSPLSLALSLPAVRMSPPRQAARSQVATILGAPLLKGQEEHHWIAPTAPTCSDERLVEKTVEETKQTGGTSSSSSSSSSSVRMPNSRLGTTLAAIPSETVAAAASGPPRTHPAGGSATAGAGSGFVHSRGREEFSSTGASLPGNERRGRGAGREASAAPVTSSLSAPAASAGVSEAAAATGPAGAAKTRRPSCGKRREGNHAPVASQEAGKSKGGQKRRRRSVACLRDHNVKGLAEDCRKGNRPPGEGALPPTRRSKRSRKQKVSVTG